MAQGCLKCLKYTMCVFNFLCFMCGTAVFGFGVYMMMHWHWPGTLANMSVAHMLFITGIIITCVSFLGFLGALKENRCLLMTFFLLLFILMLVELAAACVLLVHEREIGDLLEDNLTKSLEKSKMAAKSGNSSAMMNDWDLVQKTFHCCGVHNVSDWGDKVPASCCSTTPCNKQNPVYQPQGCLDKLKTWFEENFLSTGVSVILLCVIEVLGMCFAMTLFCHISRSGLGYKL